jgi:hypothetical protein
MFDRGASQRELRAARVAAGLCRYCGKVPPRIGSKECQTCIDRKRRSERALREKRIKQKVCAHCGKRRPKPKSLVCEHCTPKRPRTAEGGILERKRRVGDIKYLSFVEPIDSPYRKRRSTQSGYYYLVEIRSLSREFRKVFTLSKYGGRGKAFLAALKWRDERLDGLGIPKDSSAPFFSRPFKIKPAADHSTGVVGVSYHQPTKNTKGSFSASWRQDGRPRFKSFTVSRYGFEGALQAAIDHRRERIAEIYGKKSDRERAESFGDFLDLAEAYYKNSRKSESGTIAGVVFENTIRRICDKYKIVEKQRKLDDLISALARASVITQTKAKRARVAAHVRTQATHAQWDEFDLADVRVTIDFSRELMLEKLDS